MIYLKSCPRCIGDLNEGYDLFGHFLSCVQCGYELSDPQMASLKIENAIKETRTITKPQLADLARPA